MDVADNKTGLAGARQTELLLSVGLLLILVVIIIPLPTILLDTFLAANLGMSIVLLLVTLNISHPLEISVFPSMLLLLTLARLSLNVATTRLILLNADAGKIVSTFGGFVVGGNIVVGLVIFLILVIIQFIVITKGASRISEVAARFALDALPGKQMAIDSELGAGTITEDEAQKKRESLNLETEFYGSMDGAGKFVRGDAMAGLAITAINLIGGVVIGLSKGLSISNAIYTYSILTVGDGLVSQIPGLIIATIAGLLVTKASSRVSLGYEIQHQVTRHAHALTVGGMIVGALAVVPGLPKLPFLSLAALMLIVARRKPKPDPKPESDDKKKQGQSESDPLETHLQDFLQVDQACVEIGVRLIPLVDPSQDKGLIGRIADLRTEMADKHGIWVPPVRVRDNIRQQPTTYRIIINGREIAKADIDPDALLAIATATSSGKLEGTETKDPAFGLPARWISRNQKQRAIRLGYTVVDPITVMITHLGEVLRLFAADLLSRDDLSRLLDELKKSSPTLVNDIRPELIGETEIHQVLKRLLTERVPITNLGLILESILAHASKVKDPEALAELARASLGRETIARFRNEDGKLMAAILDPQLESKLRETMNEGVLMLAPAHLERFTTRLFEIRQTSIASDQEVILLCDPLLRRAIRNSIDRTLPDLMVIGYAEVPKDVDIEFKAMLKVSEVFDSEDALPANQQMSHDEIMSAA